MATVTGVTLVKKFDYRDTSDEEFSNTYHFKQSPPGNAESWEVLVSDLVAQEKKCFSSEVSYVRAYGYDSNDPHATHVFAKDFVTPGPPPLGTFLPASGSRKMAGDQAAMVEWPTDGKSTRGKTIYLRKFLHAGFIDGTDADRIEGVDYGTALVSAMTNIGFLYGGLRSAQKDLNVQATLVSGWVTTRTLKHRGKRGGPKARASLASN